MASSEALDVAAFDLLIRKVSPAGLDGLASGIKRSYEDVHGVRIKDAGLYVKLRTSPPLQGGRGHIALNFAAWRVIAPLSVRGGGGHALGYGGGLMGASFSDRSAVVD